MKLDFDKLKMTATIALMFFALNTNAQRAKAPFKKPHKTSVNKRTIISYAAPWKSNNVLAFNENIALKSGNMETFNLIKEYARYRTEEFINRAYDNFKQAASTGSDAAVYKMLKIKNKGLHCAETILKLMDKTIKEGNFTEMGGIFKAFNYSAPNTAQNLYNICSRGGVCDYKSQIEKDLKQSESGSGIWLVRIKSAQNSSSGYHVFTVIAKDGIAYVCNFNHTWMKKLSEASFGSKASNDGLVVNIGEMLNDEILNQHIRGENILPLTREQLEYLEMKENDIKTPLPKVNEINKEIAQASDRIRKHIASTNKTDAETLAIEIINTKSPTENDLLSSLMNNKNNKSLG